MTSRSQTGLALVAIAVMCVVTVACVTQLHHNVDGAILIAPNTQPQNQAAVNATATIPPGPEGELISYGRDLIVQTPKYAGSYIVARMSCAACHPRAGTVPHAGSLIGAYAKFPEWNKRAKRYIALQDRIAECFLYSMNGHPPAYYSREMLAMIAYIAWLSRGAPTGVGFMDQGPVAVKPPSAPSISRGAGIYLDRCLSCHRPNGNGIGLTFPPLWGPQSFNDRAGMSRMDRIAPFIKAAMPQNAPGSLSDQEAADVAAFILSKPRPHFDKDRMIEFPGERAGYF